MAEKQITRLSKHNDVVLIYIRDRLEETLPPAGQYRVSDGNNEMSIDTYDREYTEQYRARYHQHIGRLTRMARMNNIYLISCATNDNPLSVLQTRMNRSPGR